MGHNSLDMGLFAGTGCRQLDITTEKPYGSPGLYVLCSFSQAFHYSVPRGSGNHTGEKLMFISGSP